MFKPFVSVDEKLNKMTSSKGWKIWKSWKYPVLSGLLAIGVFGYNAASASAGAAPVSASSIDRVDRAWTSPAFIDWVNDESSSNTLVDENGNVIFTGTNRELYFFYRSKLQSNGAIFYDDNNNGIVDSYDVYFDSTDFDSLLRMALTPYSPPVVYDANEGDARR